MFPFVGQSYIIIWFEILPTQVQNLNRCNPQKYCFAKHQKPLSCFFKFQIICNSRLTLVVILLLFYFLAFKPEIWLCFRIMRYSHDIKL